MAQIFQKEQFLSYTLLWHSGIRQKLLVQKKGLLWFGNQIKGKKTFFYFVLGGGLSPPQTKGVRE